MEENTREREHAIMIVNQMKASMSGLARAIVTALKDKRVTPLEGMQLGFQGMQLATAVITLLNGLDKETVDDVLHVLEHGQFTV
jgi:hypothetical protein